VCAEAGAYIDSESSILEKRQVDKIDIPEKKKAKPKPTVNVEPVERRSRGSEY